MEKELFIIVIAIIERHGCACERTMFAVIAVKWCMCDAWTGTGGGIGGGSVRDLMGEMIVVSAEMWSRSHSRAGNWWGDPGGSGRDPMGIRRGSA